MGLTRCCSRGVPAAPIRAFHSSPPGSLSCICCLASSSVWASSCLSSNWSSHSSARVSCRLSEDRARSGGCVGSAVEPATSLCRLQTTATCSEFNRFSTINRIKPSFPSPLFPPPHPSLRWSCYISCLIARLHCRLWCRTRLATVCNLQSM